MKKKTQTTKEKKMLQWNHTNAHSVLVFALLKTRMIEIKQKKFDPHIGQSLFSM